MRLQEERREWKLPGFLYADDLVLCGESEEDLMTMVGRFVKVFRGRGLKANAGKSKVTTLGGEKGLEGEARVDGIRLEHVSEFKCLGCVFERRVAVAIRSLVNARSLQLEERSWIRAVMMDTSEVCWISGEWI